MRLTEITDAGGRKRYLAFQRSLYRGDPCYVSTSSFVLRELLCQSTPFARACQVTPVLVEEDGRVLAQAMLIFHPGLPALQVSFFEALEGQQEAADLLLAEARRRAKGLGVSQVVIGLNAHISYGVGILSQGFSYKNTFDSLYNKPWYPGYFQGLRKDTLSTYRGEKRAAAARLPKVETRVKVCPGDMSRFYQQTERMRALCERTIGRTHLYYPTQAGHFYHLMKDLRPFLRDEHLLFAQNRAGEDVGFLFWHPDFNEMLAGGREHSLFSIGAAWLARRNRIQTAKLNAIGALTPAATVALLGEFDRLTGERYPWLETNFVWDNNLPSTRLNRHLLGEPHRKYEVYWIDGL